MLGRAWRIAYLGIGLVFVGLGVLGAVLPVLPTTPFLLVSLWAFSRSSTRLERWLLEHPRFGPRLVAWQAHRVIPLSVKLTAWGSMIASLTLMTVTGVPPMARLGAASVMAIGAIYIALKPSRPSRGERSRRARARPRPPTRRLDARTRRPEWSGRERYFFGGQATSQRATTAFTFSSPSEPAFFRVSMAVSCSAL